jgi:hypothetical protein
MLYLLSFGGGFVMSEILLHFTGIGILGFLLIRGTSYIEFRRFKNEQRRRKK